MAVLLLVKKQDSRNAKAIMLLPNSTYITTWGAGQGLSKGQKLDGGVVSWSDTRSSHAATSGRLTTIVETCAQADKGTLLRPKNESHSTALDPAMSCRCAARASSIARQATTTKR